MENTPCLVLKHAHQPAWPNHVHGYETKSCKYVSSLEMALDLHYKHDAHVTQYSNPDIPRRLDSGVFCESKDSLMLRISQSARDYAAARNSPPPSSAWTAAQTEARWELIEKLRSKGGVKMTHVLFDIDGEKDPQTKECSPKWRKKIEEGVQNLFSEDEGLYYETRGGGRLVYTLEEPLMLASQLDADVWTGRYMSWLRYVSRWTKIPIVSVKSESRRHGLDSSCKDWARLFRLPHANRGDGPENRPVKGYLHAWNPALHPDDIVLPVVKDISTKTQSTGIFVEILQSRGLLGQPHKDGYYTDCPFAHEHTDGRTGKEGSAMAYGQAGSPYGTIHCYHACHSAYRGASDWLRVNAFTTLEIMETPTYQQSEKDANSDGSADFWGEQ